MFNDLEDWLAAQLSRISGKSELAEGHPICPRSHEENARIPGKRHTGARQQLCGAFNPPCGSGQKNYLFVGSEGGGKAAAIAYTLIETAKLNGVDPKHGSHGCSPRSPTTKSPGWTNSSHGVTLHTQRNRKLLDRPRAVSRTATDQLSSAGEKIVIPTPALSEALVFSGAAMTDYLQVLNEQRCFRIAAFDQKAAIEAALSTRDAL